MQERDVVIDTRSSDGIENSTADYQQYRSSQDYYEENDESGFDDQSISDQLSQGGVYN